MLDPRGLELRCHLFRAIRAYFQKEHFIEVDTPVRQPVLIPESHILPIPSGSWFLQTSPELCMKRLLARGCANIMQICQCFRGDEHGRRHLEEFTMLEWYRVDCDYHDIMHDCQNMLRSVLEDLRRTVAGAEIIDGSCLGETPVDDAWEKLTVADAFARYSPISLADALLADNFDQILVDYIEPNLGVVRPTFLYDYPAPCASLARLKESDKSVAERFELYIGGVELANGFSELTDAREQRARLAEELSRIEPARGPSVMPELFLEDLAELDTAAGIAFGVDRLLMLLMSADSIQEVVSFGPGDLA